MGGVGGRSLRRRWGRLRRAHPLACRAATVVAVASLLPPLAFGIAMAMANGFDLGTAIAFLGIPLLLGGVPAGLQAFIAQRLAGGAAAEGVLSLLAGFLVPLWVGGLTVVCGSVAPSVMTADFVRLLTLVVGANVPLAASFLRSLGPRRSLWIGGIGGGAVLAPAALMLAGMPEALIVAAFFGWSVVWGTTPVIAAVHARFDRSPAGRCWRCRYDRSATAPEAVCPECGEREHD